MNLQVQYNNKMSSNQSSTVLKVAISAGSSPVYLHLFDMIVRELILDLNLSLIVDYVQFAATDSFSGILNETADGKYAALVCQCVITPERSNIVNFRLTVSAQVQVRCFQVLDFDCFLA